MKAEIVDGRLNIEAETEEESRALMEWDDNDHSVRKLTFFWLDMQGKEE